MLQGRGLEAWMVEGCHVFPWGISSGFCYLTVVIVRRKWLCRQEEHGGVGAVRGRGEAEVSCEANNNKAMLRCRARPDAPLSSSQQTRCHETAQTHAKEKGRGGRRYSGLCTWARRLGVMGFVIVSASCWSLVKAAWLYPNRSCLLLPCSCTQAVLIPKPSTLNPRP